jgi:hypothetical protein
MQQNAVFGGSEVKTSYIAVAFIVIVLLVVSPVYLLSGNNQVRTVGSKASWTTLATYAWDYFQPGKGVDATTGLHSASLGYPYFTEWDLGLYIQTAIDAEKLGILSGNGSWGFDSRIEKILHFLETRPLASDGLPYLWYDSGSGGQHVASPTNAWDTGKLLVGLYNLKLEKPALANRIDNVVYNRTNYEPLRKTVDDWSSLADIYYYYAASGFACFWPERYSSLADTILNNIISAPTIETYGANLPTSTITCDPLVYAIFELKPNVRLQVLAKQVYLAHEARYNATGKYVAFSEGNTGLFAPSYVYEWVMFYGRPWVVQNTSYSDVQITPIIYLKTAVDFLAVYNTGFAKNMVEYILSKIPQPAGGFIDGIDENGRLVSTTVDKTNGMLVSAARYAIENSAVNVSSWQNYDLSLFPWPFVQNSTASNVSVVVAESEPHDGVGAATTVDTIGGMLITERLSKEPPNVTLNPAIDSWLINYSSATGELTLLDNTTNLIIIGNPRINLLSYYYNNLRDNLGESLLPVQYVQYANPGSQAYLYVPESGSIYKTEFNDQGKVIADYAVLMGFQDQPDRHVVVIYGLGSEATLGACQVLKDYDQWGLSGSAIILKFSVDRLGNFPTNCSIVEVVP